MPSNHLLKLTVFYLLLLFWAKAGLAGGWHEWVLFIISIIVLVSSLSALKRHWGVWKYFIFTAGSLIVIFAVSYYNPSYKNLTNKDLKELDFQGKIIACNDINKATFISNRIQTIFKTQNKSNTESLAILLGLKDSYKLRFNVINDDYIVKIIDEIESKVSLSPKSWIPSMIITDKKAIIRFYFFIFNIFSGFIIFACAENNKVVRNLCYLLFINTFILSLVGIYQKINYSFESDIKEILGIWYAPEPRYYFSTFTYKNHWSCFALMSASLGVMLIFSPLKFWGKDFLRSKELIFLTVCLLVILSTIPFSGSRSGTFLMILFIPSLLLTFVSYKSGSLRNKILLFLSFKFLILISIFMFLRIQSQTSKEIQNVSQMQLNDFKHGKMPLRWYLWADAVRTAKQSPIWGYGFETYTAATQKYQSTYVRKERNKGLANAHNPYVPLVAHAHSDVIEWWCEWGLAGFLAFFVPAICLLIGCLRRKSSPEGRILLLGAAVTIFYSLIDFPTRTPACLAMFSVCFALGMRNSRI